MHRETDKPSPRLLSLLNVYEAEPLVPRAGNAVLPQNPERIKHAVKRVRARSGVLVPPSASVSFVLRRAAVAALGFNAPVMPEKRVLLSLLDAYKLPRLSVISEIHSPPSPSPLQSFLLLPRLMVKFGAEFLRRLLIIINAAIKLVFSLIPASPGLNISVRAVVEARGIFVLVVELAAQLLPFAVIMRPWTLIA